MILTITGLALTAASALFILLADRLIANDWSRELLRILASLLLCIVGTASIMQLPGITGLLSWYHKPWKIIALLLLGTTLALWYLSRYFR